MHTHEHTHAHTAIVRAGADDKIQQVMTSATNLLEAVLAVTRKAKLSRYVCLVRACRLPYSFPLYLHLSDACMSHKHMYKYKHMFHLYRCATSPSFPPSASIYSCYTHSNILDRSKIHDNTIQYIHFITFRKIV